MLGIIRNFNAIASIPSSPGLIVINSENRAVVSSSETGEIGCASKKGSASSRAVSATSSDDLPPVPGGADSLDGWDPFQGGLLLLVTRHRLFRGSPGSSFSTCCCCLWGFCNFLNLSSVTSRFQKCISLSVALGRLENLGAASKAAAWI